MPLKNGIQVVEEIRFLFANKKRKYGVELKEPEFVVMNRFSNPTFLDHL